jgi:formylglycine-generating enzyme required for sulfatase activity/pimeloyl-ACP methyl ester carboxylesterase
VTNVRAQQLADKTVEVLFDLSGAASGGATETIAFSSDWGGTYGITPAVSTLSGHVGAAGVASGMNRRIVSNADGALPAQTYGTTYKAAVTATNPSSGGQEVTYTLPGGVPLVMVRIPAGTFQMASPETERSRQSRETLHSVTLTSDYDIGKYEVTQAQWQAVMGTNPSFYSSCGGNCPVERVSWQDISGATGFVAKLNQLLGTTKFRLPTEAEWERAARAETQTRFSFGDALDGDDNCGTNAAATPYAWWCGNAGDTTHAVGTKGANPYGLFDMHGNVSEWVEDWYGDYPTTAQTNPTGPSSGLNRVIRGGAWRLYLLGARSAYREKAAPPARDDFTGFRLARSADGSTPSCSLSCIATAPPSGSTGVSLNFQGAATPSNCTGSLSYFWEFGDGGTSSQQNPSHTYSAAGTYNWSMKASISGVTCSRSGTMVIGAPTPVRNPVLFAHGICSDCYTWDDMTANLQREAPERYGSQPRIDLYFDGTWVRNRDDDNQYYPSRSGFAQIPEGNLYTITYYDTSAGSKAAGFDKMEVKDIPIERLAGQLAAVLAAVRARNGDKAVDVVAHSMGGLVTRTLMQGLGQPQSQIESYRPGSIRQLVTVDTPHSGFPKVITDATVALLNILFPPSVYANFSVCVAAQGEQKKQMNGFPLSDFLSTLNGAQIPESVPVTAIATTTSTPWYAPGYLPEEWPHDGVVLTSSQDIKSIETYRCSPGIVTFPYSASGMIPHVTVLGKSDTALLVHGVLARDSVTGWLGGCQAFSPSIPSTLSLPGAAQPTAGTRTLILTFPVGVAAAGLRGLTETTCRATVVVRANDGRELGRYEVPASGTQTVELGVLPASGWTIELVAGCAVSVSAHIGHQPEDDFGTATRETVLPIALDVKSGSAHYTTELSLVNRGQKWALATIRYSSSLGGQGSGTVIERLSPSSQCVYGNVLEFLRQRGLPIPAASHGQQGGTLTVTFSHAESVDAVAASARTTSATAAPQPAGAAGLSYSALPTSSGSEGSVTLLGLRDNAQDRSNVAVFNPASTPVTVRMTAFAGDGTGYSAVLRDSLTLPAYGWTQVGNVFSGTGISSGWVTVQRTSASGRFGAYGVINDNATNDGSFVQPTLGTISGSRLTVPVLVETSAFRSELVLANRGSSTATLMLRYVERLTPALGSGGTVTMQLRPREQLVIPNAIEDLRRRGIAIGAMGAGSYAGALRVSVSGASLSDVFAGARTASPSPAGGQFGLFTPGVYESEMAGAEAYVYGLRADTTSRSNLAVVHAGSDSDGGVTLEVQVYDGDRGGVAAGSPRVISLSPGQWEQIGGILGGVAVQNGWVRVRRTAGTAGWLAYGVINDGGQPGERTGDGAYVPMTATIVATPPTISSFVANPSAISPGQSATLSWTSTGGTSASIDNGVGAVAPSGSLMVSPSVTTTYTLTVGGAGGTRTASTTVTVACAVSLYPLSATFGHSGGTGTIRVSATSPTCPWTAATSATWMLSITSGSSGQGNGTVTYRVPEMGCNVPCGDECPNEYEGTIVVNDKVFTVRQRRDLP